MLRVGIIGCGLIGHKRIEALDNEDVLVGVFDLDAMAAETLAAGSGTTACASLENLLAEDLDVVVVATTHNALSATACQALEAGAHVLVEKPAGISVTEVNAIGANATEAGRLVKVGFNHRFHPGIRQAVESARSGEHGPVLFARARYGHGGRLGYEQEWRMNPALSGGGELIDQGMHILDLSYWLLGPLPLHSALLRTNFWETDVEDNAALILADRDRHDPWCMLHTTWTEWKNMFSFEITCRTAKFQIDGLGGSYGPQRLTIYRMKPELGPPDIEEVEFPDEDNSWQAEWQHFKAAITTGDPETELLGDLSSARYAWQIVEEAYAA